MDENNARLPQFMKERVDNRDYFEANRTGMWST